MFSNSWDKYFKIFGRKIFYVSLKFWLGDIYSFLLYPNSSGLELLSSSCAHMCAQICVICARWPLTLNPYRINRKTYCVCLKSSVCLPRKYTILRLHFSLQQATCALSLDSTEPGHQSVFPIRAQQYYTEHPTHSRPRHHWSVHRVPSRVCVHIFTYTHIKTYT